MSNETRVAKSEAGRMGWPAACSEKCGIDCLFQLVDFLRLVPHNPQPTRIKCGAGGTGPHDPHNLKMYNFFLHSHIFLMQPHILHSKIFNNILLRMSFLLCLRRIILWTIYLMHLNKKIKFIHKFYLKKIFLLILEKIFLM